MNKFVVWNFKTGNWNQSFSSEPEAKKFANALNFKNRCSHYIVMKLNIPVLPVELDGWATHKEY
jgi:hypothetical protein